jgi:hypothetical protein
MSTPPSNSVDLHDKEILSSEILSTEIEQTSHSSDTALTWTPEEEKKLVRKIDLFLLPTIWLMYLLSYMDRTK